MDEGEGETKKIDVPSLKIGSFIVLEGAACRVTDIQISKPGKHGHSKARITGAGLIDGKKRVIVVPGHDTLDSPVIDKRTAQVLSISGKAANVMDSETFETFDLEIPDDIGGTVVEGCSVLYWVILTAKVMKQIKSSN